MAEQAQFHLPGSEMRNSLLMRSKKEKLLCHFSPFPCPESFLFLPLLSPPSLPAGSLETKGKGSRKVGVPRGTHTSLNIQNIAYEMSEELSILL